MLTRCRGSSGNRGVRERPSSAFCAEIPSGNVRLGLVTFETTYEATRAYDAAAWRLQRPRAQMNFHDVRTCEQSHSVAPPPHFITEHDCEEHRRRQRRLLIAEADERAMAELRQRYPQDVANENAFWAERTTTRRAERADKRWRKALAISQCILVNAGWESFFDSDDPCWKDAFLDTSNHTSENDSE